MSRGKIYGFTCGSFDLLHAGHILMLRECKQYCNHLIVGLQDDPTVDRPEKNKPIQSIEERFIQLSECQSVDEIVGYRTEEELMELMITNHFDIRFIGADWEGKEFTGYKLDQTIIFTSRDHGYSSSELRNRVRAQK